MDKNIMNKRNAIFLSASVPVRFPFTHPGFSDEKLQSLWNSRDNNRAEIAASERIERYRIREAIVALVGVCHEFDLDLVFGGHPSITPLVHHAAKSLRYDDSVIRREEDQWNVIIYQSKQFRKQYPPEVIKFLNEKHRLFQEIEQAKLDHQSGESDRAFESRLIFDSIQKLRREMIDVWDYGTFIAGVFIAGMDGVLDEFDRFRRFHPHAALFPIASAGGAVEMGWPRLDMPVFRSNEFDRRPLLLQLDERSEKDSVARTVTSSEALIELNNHFKDPKSITFRTLFRRLFRPILMQN